MPENESQVLIERAVVLLRDQRVILDEDLASLLGVETRHLNQHIKRHIESVSADRMFRITEEEARRLRSSAGSNDPARGGRRTLPWAFTCQGLLMLTELLPERLRHPWLGKLINRLRGTRGTPLPQTPEPAGGIPGAARSHSLSVRERIAKESELEAIMALLAAHSLREYIKQAWPVIEPGTAFMPGWHIDAIATHLEAVSRGEIRKLLINVPPRHGKSLMVSVFWPTWEWITRPELGWLFASYAMSLAVRDSVKCRRIIESPWYQRRWGQVYQLTGDQNVKSRYDNTRMGYRIALSVDSAVTGEGGDRIIVDDPHNVREAESNAIRTTTTSWWREVVSTRVNDPRTVSSS